MAIVPIACISHAGNRNPDDTPIGRLVLVIDINDVSLGLVAARVRNTTGEPRRLSVQGHAFDVPHRPDDAEHSEPLGPSGLLGTLTPRGLRAGFSA